jgi:hypothetical protein
MPTEPLSPEALEEHQATLNDYFSNDLPIAQEALKTVQDAHGSTHSMMTQAALAILTGDLRTAMIADAIHTAVADLEIRLTQHVVNLEKIDESTQSPN